MAWLTLWGHEIFIQRRTRCHSRQLRPIKKRLNQNDCEIGGVRLKADSLRLSADAVLSTPPEHLNKYPPGQFGEQRRGRHALNIWVFLWHHRNHLQLSFIQEVVGKWIQLGNRER